MKYIAGASAAAGFCLTALVLYSHGSDEHAAFKNDSIESLAKTQPDEHYTQPVTPEIMEEIKEAGLIYKEKTPAEERAALHRLEVKTAAAYGEEFDLDAAEAAKRLERQVPLSNAIQSITKRIDAKSLAGWGVDHTDGQVGWVSVTDISKITEEISHILAQNPDIEIRLAEFSYQSLKEKQDQFSQSLEQPDPSSSLAGLSDLIVHTDIDVSNNQLVVALDENAAVFKDESSKEQVMQKVKEHFDYNSDIPVNIILAPSARPTMPPHPYVGGYLYVTCTSGFTTRHNSGEFGFITAGHCNNLSVSQGKGTFRFIIEHFFGLLDVQLHAAHSGAEVSPYFAFGRGRNDFIRQSGTMSRHSMMGLWVCNHGWGSGYSCGTVNSLNFRPSGGGYPRNRNFSFVSYSSNQLRGCGGDSGGPVFVGSTALGIISGGVSNTSHNDCRSFLNGPIANTFFSSIRESLNSVGSHLLTR